MLMTASSRCPRIRMSKPHRPDHERLWFAFYVSLSVNLLDLTLSFGVGIDIILSSSLLSGNSVHILLDTVSDGVGSHGRCIGIAILLCGLDVVCGLLIPLEVSFDGGFGLGKGFVPTTILFDCGRLDGRDATNGVLAQLSDFNERYSPVVSFRTI